MVTAAAPTVSPTVRARGRWFYIGLAVVAAIVVFAGFERTYYLKQYFGTPRLPLLLHVHGLVFTLWLLLFFVQPLLVKFGRIDLHRQLGIAGGVLAGAMTVIIVVTSIEVTRPGFRAGPPAPLGFLSLPFINIGVFAILVAAGLRYRKKPETHKRLMTVATISILSAAFARLPIALIQSNGALGFFLPVDLVLLACIAYDLIAKRRLYAAYAWGGILLIASQFGCVYVGGTAWFQSFAQWLTSLPI